MPFCWLRLLLILCLYSNHAMSISFEVKTLRFPIMFPHCHAECIQVFPLAEGTSWAVLGRASFHLQFSLPYWALLTWTSTEPYKGHSD